MPTKLKLFEYPGTAGKFNGISTKPPKKLRKPRVLEKDITKAIRRFLDFKKIFHWKVWQGLGSVPGVPDILAIHKGKLIGIEVKTEKGKLSDKQAEFMAKMSHHGAIVFIAHSAKEVEEHLIRFGVI